MLAARENSGYDEFEGLLKMFADRTSRRYGLDFNDALSMGNEVFANALRHYPTIDEVGMKKLLVSSVPKRVYREARKMWTEQRCLGPIFISLDAVSDSVGSSDEEVFDEVFISQGIEWIKENVYGLTGAILDLLINPPKALQEFAVEYDQEERGMITCDVIAEFLDIPWRRVTRGFKEIRDAVKSYISEEESENMAEYESVSMTAENFDGMGREQMLEIAEANEAPKGLLSDDTEELRANLKGYFFPKVEKAKEAPEEKKEAVGKKGEPTEKKETAKKKVKKAPEEKKAPEKVSKKKATPEKKVPEKTSKKKVPEKTSKKKVPEKTSKKKVPEKTSPKKAKQGEFGWKIQKTIQLLSRKRGVTMDDLVEAVGTTKNSLGVTIARLKKDRGLKIVRLENGAYRNESAMDE